MKSKYLTMNHKNFINRIIIKKKLNYCNLKRIIIKLRAIIIVKVIKTNYRGEKVNT